MSQQNPFGPNNESGSQPSNQPDFDAPSGPSPQGGSPGPQYQSGPQTQPGPQYQSGPQNQSGPQYQSGPQAQPGPQYQSGPQAQPGPQYQSGPQNQSGPQYQQAPQSGPQYSSGPGYQSGPPNQPGPQPGAGGYGYGYAPTPHPQQPAPKNRLPWIIGIGVLVVALLVGGWYFFGRDLLGGSDDPTDMPTDELTQGPGGEVPEGELPEQPKIEAPAVIDEVAAAAGLTCHDEVTTGIQIKGCYLHEPNHLITLRFQLTDSGEIDKVRTTVLHNDTTPEQRSEELLALLDPVLPTLPLSDADREAFRAAITGTETDVNGDTEWHDGAEGQFNYRFSTDTSTASVGNDSLPWLPETSLSDNPAAVVEELEARDWACEVDGITTDCTGPGRGSIVLTTSDAGLEEGELHLVGVMVWFDGSEPLPDEPRMIDAYAALSKAGEKGEALAIGLRMLSEGEKQFFNSDLEFYHGDSYYEIGGVSSL